MSFQIAYVGGGMLDKIRSVSHLDSGRLDAPYMPTLVRPYVIGGFVECHAEDNSFIDKIAFDKDVEMLLAAVDAESYESDDSWDVYVNGKSLIKDINAVKYPEGLNLMVAHPIPAGTEIMFVFHNYSGTKKNVWYHYQFLMGDGPVKQVPTKTEQPPIITFDSFPNPLCYQNIIDQKYTIEGDVSDDLAVSEYATYVNNQLDTDIMISPPKKQERFRIDIPIEVPPPPKPPKVDITFLFDTSGSMGNDIENVKKNLNKFKESLDKQGFDVMMGSINSNHDSINRKPLTPSSEFNLNNIGLDGGKWEVYKWEQFIDSSKGLAFFFPEYRKDSLRFAIVLTDTKIYESISGSVIQPFIDTKTHVTVVHQPQHRDYDSLISKTGGLNLNLNSPDFSTEMDKISKLIIDSIVIPPPEEVTVKVTASDTLGLKATKEVKLKLVYCEDDK